MDFTTYLHSKKIDSAAYKKADPDRWDAWSNIFNQMHPASFTAQKLYLINPLRRQFPYQGKAVAPQVKKAEQVKPRIQPKPSPPKTVEGSKPKVPVKPKIAKPTDEPSKPPNQNEKIAGKPKRARPVIKRPKND